MSDSDICESAAGMELALEAARQLSEICPEHELLDLFKKTDEVWESFQARFGKEGLSREQRSCEPAQAFFWANYFLALKEACKDCGLEI